MTQKVILSLPRSHQSQHFAADMARRHLLQNLNVCPVLDLKANATAVFEVPASVVPARCAQSNHVR